ncbi:21_t:CDS:2 [Racocetra persica]|uniref:21_t:CDS:1 n=1 Tax=Racocetra persica TaxID=160502 RepID=A0ACA9RCI2_9GLOM|nr:21_t:CDS:2 [Racocetra persica]
MQVVERSGTTLLIREKNINEVFKRNKEVLLKNGLSSLQQYRPSIHKRSLKTMLARRFNEPSFYPRLPKILGAFETGLYKNCGKEGRRSQILVGRRGQSYTPDDVSEWLRSVTRNHMGSARTGSSPVVVATTFFLLIFVTP